MDEHIFDKVHEVDLKKTMEDSYIDYAMRWMLFGMKQRKKACKTHE